MRRNFLNKFVDGFRSRGMPVLAGVSGNLMEWYDFGLYGVLAATLGKLFFSDGGGFVGLLAVYGVFAAGYLARVAGGMMLGHIADRYGRRRSLLLSAFAMALATFLVGCLPTIQMIGVAAPVLFTIFRLIQGLSVGGEFTTSLSFLIENAPPNRRAFHGSFAAMSATTGLLLGSGTGNLLFSIFTPDEIANWAWRIPFWLSLPMGLVIAVLRRVLPDDAPAEHANSGPSPVARVLKEHPAMIVRGALLGWGSAAAFYLMAVFLSSYLATEHYLEEKTALAVQTMSIATVIVAMPLSGLLADMFGRKKMVLFSSMACVLLVIPLFLVLRQGSGAWDFMAAGIFSIVVAAGFTPYQVWIAELFPHDMRGSGLGISYNIAAGFFGGTTPLLATALIQFSGNPVAPAVLVVISSLITIGAAWSLKDTARKRTG